MKLLCALTISALITITTMGSVGKDYDGSNPQLEEWIAATWPPELVDQAIDVAWCESRGKPTARNGRFKGLFQMGDREWIRYGNGKNPFDPIANSAAAYRYWTAVNNPKKGVTGWRPWECQPTSTEQP